MRIDYCYIDDVLENRKQEKFIIEKYCFDKDNLDPDLHSKKLYEDLAAILNKNNEMFQFQPLGTEIKDKQERRYGSDYIGPSWNWAKSVYGFDDLEIARGLKKTRLLGGHMLWLRTISSINQQKGGRGIYDRFDLCLDEIRDAYKNDFSPKVIHKTILRRSICSQQAWFKEFGVRDAGFKKFVDFFYLNDFVNDAYEVISLSISECNDMNMHIRLVKEEDEKIKEHRINAHTNCYLPGKQFDLQLSLEDQKNAYRNYIQNCIYLIEKRTKRMISANTSPKTDII